MDSAGASDFTLAHSLLRRAVWAAFCRNCGTGSFAALIPALHLLWIQDHFCSHTGQRIAIKGVSGFSDEKGKREMLERGVIGNKEWTIGILTDVDVRFLEDFDCEMRIRYLQQRDGPKKIKTYEQLVDEHGDKVPTHCEHGILLYRRCGLCRALFG